MPISKLKETYEVGFNLESLVLGSEDRSFWCDLAIFGLTDNPGAGNGTDSSP
jgi:hypothetical protein